MTYWQWTSILQDSPSESSVCIDFWIVMDWLFWIGIGSNESRSWTVNQLIRNWSFCVLFPNHVDFFVVFLVPILFWFQRSVCPCSPFPTCFSGRWYLRRKGLRIRRVGGFGGWLFHGGWLWVRFDKYSLLIWMEETMAARAAKAKNFIFEISWFWLILINMFKLKLKCIWILSYLPIQYLIFSLKDEISWISKYIIKIVFEWIAVYNYNSKPVSYTHLRAHETSLHLVCPLLLEKTLHFCR